MAKEVKAVNDDNIKEAKEVKAVNDADTLVPVFLFKDKDKYKDDLFVAVNGDSVLIKRGEQVMVKKKFANIVQQSLMQDNKTADLVTKESKDYKEKAKNI